MKGFSVAGFYLKITILFIHCTQVSAQENFGNEWIGAAGTYLRISVAATGLYQISKQQLIQAGVPAGNIDPRTFQLYRRGREVAMEVGYRQNEWDALIFFGEKNDGAGDTALYISPAAQPHRKYSLYADSAVYFLIWGQKNGERVVKDHTVPTGTTDYLWQDSEQLYISHYAPGPFYPEGTSFPTGAAQSGYDEGEGWTGPEILPGQKSAIALDLPGALQDPQKNASVAIVVTGRSPGMHHCEVWVDGQYGFQKRAAAKFENYKSLEVTFPLTASDFENSREIRFQVHNAGNFGTFSVSYVNARYQRINHFQADQQLIFTDSLQANTFWKHKAGAAKYYDCTNPYALRRLASDSSGVAVGGAKSIIAASNLKSVSQMELRRFPKPDPASVSYLIITHTLLRKPIGGADPVNAYAAYRASEKGGSYQPLVLSMDEVADLFNSGEPGPAGIRKCIAWFQRQGALQFVFLIGQSEDPQHVRKQPDARRRDMVPNAGWPGSDLALVTNKNGDPFVPIGRLNAGTGQQIMDYLEKVKSMEAEPAHAAWRRNVLHVSGGRSRDELIMFRQFMAKMTRQIAAVGLHAQTFNKQTAHDTEPASVQPQVNEGAALLTFFGHSGIDMTDFDIGYADAPGSRYANHPRYPAVIVNGCASGSIFYSRHALSQNWIFAPKSGAVLFLAHTFNASANSLQRYTSLIYEVLADTLFLHQSFGKIVQEAILRGNARNPDLLDQITAGQMILHGDPAIRIFPESFSPITPATENADHIPPLLHVLVDGKHVRDADAVAAKPTFNITISDNSQMLADTALFSIWVKKQCTDCPWRRIDLIKSVMKMLSANAFEVGVMMDEPLEPGSYHLLVEGRDVANNLAEPYEIDFVVAEKPGITSIEVSPNPSADWFRFTVQAQGLTHNSGLTLTIADLQGRLVYKTFLSITNGRNEVFWRPAGQGTRMYIYRFEPDESQPTLSSDGVSATTGRLLQVE